MMRVRPRAHAMQRLAAAVVLVCASLLAGFAYAEVTAIEQLRQFIAGSASAQGRFAQVVTAVSGRRPQLASGNFAFMRPGRFRWVYEQPYAQMLVSDGERLWSWDRDLDQVTVRVLGDALGNSPAAILAGDGNLERDFELREGGVADGLAWVLVTPRQPGSAFEWMRIGFVAAQLKRMELRDQFGQTTMIEFSDLVVGEPLDPDLFRFTPPAGADVIGD